MVKTFLFNLIMWLLFGLFVLGIILIYAALRKLPPNWYVLLTGVVAAGIPLLIFAIHYYRETRAYEDTRDGEIAYLKKNGVKIPVDLTKCAIGSNQWTEEQPRYETPRVVLLNEISGHGDKNVQRVDIAVSVLQYAHHFNGQKKIFTSNSIYKDRTTLGMLLEMQQQTAIYVDPNNSNRYYFDLEFLGEEDPDR